MVLYARTFQGNEQAVTYTLKSGNNSKTVQDNRYCYLQTSNSKLYVAYQTCHF